MRNLALGDLTDDDLRRMLAEHESMFVEHKGALRAASSNDDAPPAYQVAKAACSFANTLGGWVLVGVKDGKPQDWDDCMPAEMTDRVRVALAKYVDPMPPFVATVRDFDGAKVGVIRVMESSDTPHVMRDGKVFVRSVAEDQNKAKHRRYTDEPVAHQSLLFELVERGRSAQASVLATLAAPETTTLVSKAIGIRNNQYTEEGHLTLRVMPLSRHRFADWAVSRSAVGAGTRALTHLASNDDHRLVPHPAGFAVSAAGVGPAIGDGPSSWGARVAVDGAGVVGASFVFGRVQPRPEPTPITLDQVGELFGRLVQAACSTLEAGEFLGRAQLEVRIGGMSDPFDLVRDGERSRGMPGSVSIGGAVTLPRDDASHGAIRRQLRDDYARYAGVPAFR